MIALSSSSDRAAFRSALGRWRRLTVSEKRELVRRAKSIGAAYGVRVLLTRAESNPKIAKSDKRSARFASIVLHLAPSTLSGFNTCSHATVQCAADCLHTAGVPFMQSNKDKARIARTRFLFAERQAFLVMLAWELELAERRAVAIGRRLACRLNGTSDMPWHRMAPELFRAFRGVRFYDYTKDLGRFSERLPRNYDLTLSRSEVNEAECLEALSRGARVACVFSTTRNKPLPRRYRDVHVVDGDSHDLTFLRPRGAWIGLRAKGRARLRKDGGFVVQV